MRLSIQSTPARYSCANLARRLSHARPGRPGALIGALIGGRNGFLSASPLHKHPISTLIPPRLPKTTSRTSLSFQQCHAYTTHPSTTNPNPFRAAIIGSGPAGFYTAYRLLSKLLTAHVDMYEQLPVPYGLARFGVAPDHPEVKNCENKFEEVAEDSRFTYIGNVAVGRDVELKEMKAHYDSIIFAYGASQDRKLGIPGEDLGGVYSAREFVGWYNGLPQLASLAPALDAGEDAIVIGQGNVALDVARILLTPVDALRKTDITEAALETLAKSRVKRVKVVGRRGPLQAAFTVKEVRELMHIPGVSFTPISSSFYPENPKSLPRIQRRIGEVLLKGTPDAPPDTSPKNWSLSFLLSPKSFNPSPDNDKHISSITFAPQRFADDADRYSNAARVVPNTEEQDMTLPASVAFRSIGYKSAALLGLSDIGVLFDSKLGVIPNDAYGRVMSPSLGPGNLSAGHVPGLYCAGWVKRGPTGVIASTMKDAFTTADVVVQDWAEEVPFLGHEEGAKGERRGWDALREKVESRGVRPVGWKEWHVIDKVEKERGAAKGKPREKFGTVEEMLEVLDR
ncbi:nucleotide-binding domain-containing protein [Westerdykella ornata]|uniref:NADPH:adrenodoxin oxidoreductase, mitochondrial n=1 Tax=Westerdykella ornata TaxID=318751 RepID=A0A6A6JS04_WESOR|nr:nucleotide-binding domain-containing protein [Westerdykella ornata]KAF2279342.1 nucleotide-binding domain-containing protein [Westerdykella ornata]